MAATLRPAQSGFFATNTVLIKPQASLSTSLKKEPRFVNVGGNGDCGFLAIASGIIDNAYKIRPNQIMLSKLLEQHNNYFPLPPFQGLVTSAERLKAMVGGSSTMAKLIRELGYTLRQMSVDELCANDVLYRGAFVANNEGTSPDKMRMQTTEIDESYIAALSEALKIPITVQVVEKSKEVPARFHYGQNYTASDEVVIQLQNKHYIPRLTNAALFESVSEQPVRALEPKASEQKADPELAEILKRIEAEDNRLLHVFDTNLRRLQNLVEDGEIDKDYLLTIYIKGMNNSDYLQGRIKHVGLEHGNQNFFNAIESARRPHAIVGLPKGSHDEQVTKELIHAIARAISIGQLDAEDVFDLSPLENTGKTFKK
ncbi:MAG: hypothetical protein Q8M03_09485 [Legionella sp.]|nr:hypothetical protein [Legionella sp.]